MFGCQILGEFYRHYSWFNFNPKSAQFGIGGPSPQSGVILFYPHGRLVHTISYIYNIWGFLKWWITKTIGLILDLVVVPPF